jgi:calcineurin-like phosphoesterase
MRILFIGDIVGKPGRQMVARHLKALTAEHGTEMILANAENAAGGFGITPSVGEELLSLGIDLLTSGNHVWDKKEAEGYLAKESRVLRPANYPEEAPGVGVHILRPSTYRPNACFSAVIGTHTHVQTADEQVLPGRTAYITDVGMTGPRNSVIGIRPEDAIQRFLTQMPRKFTIADGPTQLCAVVVDIGDDGRARSITRLQISDD